MADAFTSTPPPVSRPVITGGGGAVRDSYTVKVPAGGGIPEQQAEIAVQNAEAQQKEIAKQTGELGIEQAKATEAGAQAIVPLAQDYAALVAKAEGEFGPKIQRAGDDFDKSFAEAASRKYVNHWADQSTGTKVLAAISSFLGGLATGTPVSRAQEWIDRDYMQQKEQMERLMKVAEAKGANRDHLVALEAATLKNLDAGYLGKIEAFKREVEHQAARIGTQQAQVNAQKLIADVDAAAAARKQKAAEDLRIQIVAHTINALRQKGIPVTKTADGRVVWKNPMTGMWDEMLRPLQPTPAIAAPPPAAPVQPTQPPPVAAPPVAQTGS